ncbi:hypothetical protein GIB67_036900 [Kingdonia uniflora]|uniref:Defective in cullin neddylation protein n=1 Tax=Kingdonia uniflora TaxID=39325 RepID=A0A7J7NW60_9MAGN|nr:hypothetical protein GIB67_036900 [Kingdonia uniflora]
MRRSTRKTGSKDSSASANSTPADLFRSASSKAISKELERIDHLFNSYADKSSGMIDPEGIEALCSDVEVDHTDIRILMLAWKMKAEQQGYFTLEEWRRGLKSLKVDTISKLKKALPELEKEVVDSYSLTYGTPAIEKRKNSSLCVRRPQTYEDFYSYAFRYCLTEEKQKSIDIESICELLDLVLGSQFRSLIDSLIEYLKIQSDYKVINMDQWTGFLRFCNENAEKLDNLFFYSELMPQTSVQVTLSSSGAADN